MSARIAIDRDAIDADVVWATVIEDLPPFVAPLSQAITAEARRLASDGNEGVSR